MGLKERLGLGGREGVVSFEDALVGAARRGDRAAFGKLYDLHARMIHGVLLSRVPAGEADDLVQEVFLQAWQKLPTLKDPSAFRPWLAAIARRKSVDYLRARRTDQGPPPEDMADTPRPRAEAMEVLRIIQAMPEAYRETLVMRLVEGMTGPEIAEQTGLTPASVRVNLHRGMKLLRETLGVEAKP